MSSFEANTYTVKPTAVQVGNSLTVTKPIIASNLLIKPQVEQRSHTRQPKKIQPQSGTSTAAVFQLKSFQKTPPGGTPQDFSRVGVTRKQTTLDSVTIRKSNKDIANSRAGIPAQKKILAGQAALPDNVMGNEQGRSASGMSPGTAITDTTSSTAMVSTQQILNSQTTAHLSNIPLPVATLNAGQGLAPRMASIINSPGDIRIPSPGNSSMSVGPRVVSTSSSKTITGSMAAGTVKQHHISHRPSAGPIGARTAVIQSAPSGRNPQQQPIIRSVTPPMRPVHSQYRPINPVTLGHQSQNPTTVQITIHQPKSTATSVPAPTSNTDRLPANTLYSTGPHGNQQTHPPHPVTATSLSMGSQPGLQRLVISQSPSGVIQQNKSTVPYGQESRIIAANTTFKKAVRGPTPSGQHDYIRSEQLQTSVSAVKKGATDSNSTPSRLGVSLHTVPDNKMPANTGFVPAATTAVSTSPSNNFHPTTINHVDQPPPVFKAHSFSVPTIISSSSRTNSAGPPTVIMGDNSHDGSNPYGINMPRAGPSPSILRKRPHEGHNTVVVKKLSQPLDRLAGYDKVSSQPSSPGRHHLSNAHTEKDNASQSSTDTAMSSESPNQSAIKPEPPETVENGEAEPQPPDVSPRKKPRKQLLKPAAELKDRHDSSTEEETETKLDNSPSPILDAYNMEYSKLSKGPSDADGFLDGSGVKWVQMRKRNSSSLINTYPYAKQWNSRLNHFQRSSDFKLKEERRPVVSELSNQRGIQQKVNGWKFYHLSSQFQEMMDTEQVLYERMGKLQKFLPNKTKDKHPELSKLYELVQANKQRCSLTKDQLLDAKQSLFKILDTHKPKVLDIIQKNHSKRPVKKKDRS